MSREYCGQYHGTGADRYCLWIQVGLSRQVYHWWGILCWRVLQVRSNNILWKYLSSCRAPLPCSCGDVDQIDEIHIADMTEELFLERCALSMMCLRGNIWLSKVCLQQQTLGGEECHTRLEGYGGAGLWLAKNRVPEVKVENSINTFSLILSE